MVADTGACPVKSRVTLKPPGKLATLGPAFHPARIVSDTHEPDNLRFGESVLLPEYRGRGLGVRFFHEREDHARALGRFDLTCFCAVDRPLDHPRRPAGYQPLDRFWEKRGYRRQPALKASFSWQDLDEDRESPKSMTFWMKRLRD